MRKSLLPRMFCNLCLSLLLPALLQGADSPKPNIVIIFTDDQGYGDIGCYGNEKNKTPRLDQLAKEGTLFTSFYSQTVCGPSRSALLTGRQPLRSKGWDMPADEVTWAELMQEAGYQTVCIGKWDVSNRKPILERMPNAQGFDYYYGALGANDSGKMKLHENNEAAGTTEDMGAVTTLYTDKSINWLKEKRDPEKPFVLYLAHTMMHTIIEASDRFRGKSAGGLYGDVVEEFDYETGRLLDTIDELKLSENTLVIYTSDNGPWNQDKYTKKKKGHPEGSIFWGDPGPLRNGKGSCYEGGYRLPCIVRWPGKIPAGKTSDAIFATIDFLPTFAHLAGFNIPTDRPIDGIDQTPLLLGKREVGRKHFYFQGAGIRQGKWKYLKPKAHFHGYAVEDDREQVEELYDLDADLGEQSNLAAEHPEKVAELKALMEAVEKSEISEQLAVRNPAEILIADFEGKTYGDWKVEGEAFGSGPANGTLARQNEVSGYQGKRLVNSFLNGDRTTGSLSSPAFTLNRDYLRFLIGGGSHSETALQLLIDGKVVASCSGFDNERLELEMIDVKQWKGEAATLRIVDRHQGGWGHVNVDSIVLTDVKPDVPQRITSWNIGEASSEPFEPVPFDQSYREDWRPQFHFSPRVEWMNDINALIYDDGTYHMLYQWGKSVRHGGYATSKDLLHWDDKGVALVPQRTFLPEAAVRNVSGDQVFSGSGVWVDGEIARKITGSDKPALVTHYTGTKVGTCIAWSNDSGVTWHNYKDNPVAHPTKGVLPRDPCVIWYEPTKTWILGIYDTSNGKKGTALYGSKDLIEWEKLSFLDFGYECPDIVELPLDGDRDQMKWVIYDAAGEYLVGQFDGKTFTDENGVDGLMMDLGPDFYAGQSFFPHNLPEKKYIQIAWMDEWNGGIGEEKGGWHRNATFPVELGLVTHEGKMRVTRTPIAAIEELYTGKPSTLADIEVSSDNVLKDIRSKAFDATLTLDLNGVTAKEIVFSVTNVDYRYNIAEQTLEYVGVENNKFGSKEPPVLKPNSENKLVLRMLVDWSSIEIFSDEGVFSFSQHVAFDPKDDRLSLKAIGGKVKLESLTLNPIKSIWKEFE